MRSARNYITGLFVQKPKNIADPKDRFERTDELVELCILIRSLREKNEALKRSSSNPKNNVALDKHFILKNLLSQIDAAIKISNDSKNQNDESDEDEKTLTELQEMINLVGLLQPLIRDVIDKHHEKLSVSRNHKREYGNNAAKVALYGGAAATAIVAPLPTLLSAPALFYGSYAAGNKVQEQCAETATMMILRDLNNTLMNLMENLTNRMVTMATITPGFMKRN